MVRVSPPGYMAHTPIFGDMLDAHEATALSTPPSPAPLRATSAGEEHRQLCAPVTATRLHAIDVVEEEARRGR
jgi:hypothetical protein